MIIVKYRKIFYTLSIILVVASITAMAVWGFSLGIDFKGGSSVEFQYSDSRPSVDAVKQQIDSISLEPSVKDLYTLMPTGDKGYVLNLRTITEEERNILVGAISSSTMGQVEIKKFNSVGPTLGQEAARKSLMSIVLVILCIVLFLTFAFRKVSKPVSSWKYGIVSIIALCHDVIIPAGIFVALHHFFGGYEIDTLFVTAILVILGFSVHDTIVVFDRVRENLRNNHGLKNPKNFEEIVGESISQTFIRSINTSLTTLLAVLVVFLAGPIAIKNFSLALLIGIFFGTYSSIFIGSNLLVTIEKWQGKGESKK
ncbi:MAG: protein translocase subunit SecF [Candidatus Paceibacterota bacterium]|jgi:preprotein translocase subunit SecF